MAKFQVALVLLLVLLSIFGSEAQRQRGARSGRLQRNRKLARQEVEEPVTPYPSADELKPEIPFDEAAPVPAPADDSAVVEVGEASVDENAEGASNEPIPDEVYGPPEVAVLYNIPDEVYGPPELEANLLPLARQRQRQARLIQARRQAAYRQARLAKLRAAKPKRSA